MDNLIRLIKRYQSQGEEGYETNVTAIVNRMIRISGKDDDRYIVKEEVFYGSIQDVPDLSRSLRPDKCIFELITIDHGDKEEPLLVIECKHHNSVNNTFSQDNKNQLKRYMIAALFPYGMLVSEFYTEFYKLNKEKLSVKKISTYKTLDDLQEIINTIKDF